MPVANLFFSDSAIATALYGQLNVKTRSYFGDGVTINDPRSARSFPETLIPFSTTAMELITNSDELVARGSDYHSGLFNAIEHVFYFGLTTSADEIEAYLQGSIPDYVSGTLVKQGTIEVASVRFETGPFSATMPQMISFQTGPLESRVEVRVWFDNTYMVNNWTETQILALVPPMELNALYAQISLHSSAADLVIAADIATYMADRVSEVVEQYDATGVYTLKVRYYSGDTNTIIPFNLVYCGHKPGTLEAQRAVAEMLLSSGVGDKAGWTERLPSLFVSGTFFIIPVWDNIISSVNRTNQSRSIIAYSKVGTILSKAAYDMQPSHGFTEILSTPYNCLFALAIPDEKNTQQRFSLMAEHPTYQDYASNNSSFAFMEAETQRMSAYLNRALAMAIGETNDTIFDVVNMDDRVFIGFHVDDLAYYVLNKESYLRLMA